MASYSKNEVVLIEVVYTDLSSSKVRPAVIVHGPHPSQDILAVPLSSRMNVLLPGEFKLNDWSIAGLHVPTAAKRGIYTVHSDLVRKAIGKPSSADAISLDRSLRMWLDLS